MFQGRGKDSTNNARKERVGCGFHHRIVHVSDCYLGRVHDIAAVREGSLLEHVNDCLQITADTRYIAEKHVVTPRRTSHGQELTNEDEKLNGDIKSTRAAFENINQRLETVGGVQRGDMESPS